MACLITCNNSAKHWTLVGWAASSCVHEVKEFSSLYSLSVDHCMLSINQLLLEGKTEKILVPFSAGFK